MYLFKYAEHLALLKLREAIDRAPNTVKAWEIVKRFEAATESAVSHAHLAVHNELLEILNISSNSDDMDEEPTKEPSHDNPEEAANYLKAVNNLLDKFVNDIRGFNPYACRDAYKNFVHTLSQLLS